MSGIFIILLFMSLFTVFWISYWDISWILLSTVSNMLISSSIEIFQFTNTFLKYFIYLHYILLQYFTKCFFLSFFFPFCTILVISCCVFPYVCFFVLFCVNSVHSHSVFCIWNCPWKSRNATSQGILPPRLLVVKHLLPYHWELVY